MQTCDTAPAMMPLEQAVQKIISYCTQPVPEELLKLKDCHNRILANTIRSNINVPPSNNSAMDGYAFAFDDLQQHKQWQVIGTAYAGRPFTGHIKPGECVRIMTGAILPAQADTVVMQENTASIQEDKIEISHPPETKGENVRYAGEDIKSGEVVFTKGTKLTAAHCALLASLGVDEVEVHRPVLVSIFATGDELIEAGKILKQGQIYESNRTALTGLLAQYPVIINDLGIIPDTPQDTEKALIAASRDSDLVISCGGVSVGDADFVKSTLDKLGNVEFWKVAIKPGKPFAFGQINKALFCGLPGNPVSSYVTFEQLVKPLLDKLQGLVFKPPTLLSARLSAPLYKRPGRTDFQRGTCTIDEQGVLQVKPNARQGSGILSSVTNANCYIVVDAPLANLATGETVKVQLFDGF